ncbi:hypothetical protein [Cardiobacterium valvarum]|uniref:Uncharacterized protein n=1 Tax=Cardiobacterium valvarum TaxID=194702 RepID=A0A381E039_9GAMM|nr:hypothetical protein [Cardiobacterium valvarum]SUX19184.1 Uncharacterised protein [Cardiobacterium valvarum]
MNQRQYAAPIGAPFTSLIFTCKRGNLIYILLLAAIASPVCVTLLKIMKNSDFFSTPQQPIVALSHPAGHYADEYVQKHG